MKYYIYTRTHAL